jgi:hypothetical protein
LIDAADRNVSRLIDATRRVDRVALLIPRAHERPSGRKHLQIRVGGRGASGFLLGQCVPA